MPSEDWVNAPRQFKKLASEESHTVESFERRIHETPDREPERHFTTNSYTERRTYGRDENGEIVVKIEKDPKEPVRPVSPVEPIGPSSMQNNGNIPNFDTLPLSIPRVDARRNASSNSPRSVSTYNNEEEISPNSLHSSYGYGSPNDHPRYNQSDFDGRAITSKIPMKKVTKKSRWVSVHDGRPVSPYVEDVRYQPAGTNGNYKNAPYHSERSIESTTRLDIDRPSSKHHHHRHRDHDHGDCQILMLNPLYREY